jgi:hypothetical protein
MKDTFLILLFLFFTVSTSIAGKKLNISKGDTICLLPIQNQILNRSNPQVLLDSSTAAIAAQYIYQKCKKILSQKYNILECSNNSQLSSEQFKELEMQFDAFNKSETGEVALSENLKSIFSNSSTRFQLQIVQFGQYYQEDRKQVYSRGIPLSNGNNIFYFILLDKQNDNIIFIEKSKSFGDVRDKEQTDRQILKCLRKLYYN